MSSDRSISDKEENEGRCPVTGATSSGQDAVEQGSGAANLGTGAVPTPSSETAGAHFKNLSDLNADLQEAELTIYLPPNFDKTLAPVKATGYRAWLEQDPKTRNHAKFCLPLTMASSAGYFILSPATFVVEWDGHENHDCTFEIIESSTHATIDAHAAFGSFTVQSEFSVKTKQAGDFVYIRGIANQARLPYVFMDAMIEAWWTPARFGLVALLNQAGRFTVRKGEPIAQMFVVSHHQIDYELDIRDGFPPMYEVWNEAHQAKHEKGKNFTYLRGLWPDNHPLPDGCPHYRAWKQSPDSLDALGQEQLNQAAFSPEEAKLEALGRRVAQVLESGNVDQVQEAFDKTMQAAENRRDTGYGVLDRLKRIALNFIKAGQFARAESIYKAALELACAGDGKGSLAEAQQLSYLAECYLFQNKNGEAEENYLKALELLKLPPYNEGRLCFTVLCGLGQVYNRIGRYADGERVLEQAVALRQKNAGRDFSETLQATSLLAHNYLAAGRYGEAESLFNDILERRRKAAGNNAPEVADSLVDLGFACRRQNKLDEAANWFEQALATKRQTLGPDNQAIKPYLEYLAFVYKDADKLTAAEPFFLELLALKEANPTTSRSELARTYVDLGFLVKDLRKGDVEKYFLKALACIEEEPAVKPSELAQHLEYIAYWYIDQKLPAKAIAFFTRELDLLEKESSDDTTRASLKRVLENLIYAHAQQKETSKVSDYQARLKKLTESGP